MRWFTTQVSIIVTKIVMARFVLIKRTMKHSFIWAAVAVWSIALSGCESSDPEPAEGTGGQAPAATAEQLADDEAGVGGSGDTLAGEIDEGDGEPSTAGVGGAVAVDPEAGAGDADDDEPDAGVGGAEGETNDCPDELPSGACESGEVFSCTGWVYDFVEVYCTCEAGTFSCAM
jgi:hypothetical protein